MNQTDFLFMLIPALVALGGGILAMFWHPSHQSPQPDPAFCGGRGAGGLGGGIVAGNRA